MVSETDAQHSQAAAGAAVDRESADTDPVVSNPDFYRVLWENSDVRVLEYRDRPGEETTPHTHPHTVMVTLTDFRRRLMSGDQARDVSLASGTALWLPAQSHSGKNIGATPTHTILIELKHSDQHDKADALGPVLGGEARNDPAQ